MLEYGLTKIFPTQKCGTSDILHDNCYQRLLEENEIAGMEFVNYQEVNKIVLFLPAFIFNSDTFKPFYSCQKKLDLIRNKYIL